VLTDIDGRASASCAANAQTGAYSVTATPLSLGRSASFSLTNTALGVAVPTVSLNPTTLAFAVQAVGTTSVSKTITLTNTSTALLKISSIVANGDFARTTSCGATLAPAASCAINVTFTPTMAALSLGNLVITSDAASSPNAVSLSGSGGVTVSYAISVNKSGTGTGTVTSSPAGINCGAICSASFASGSSSALTATAAAGSTFNGWSGACSGTGTCTVNMSQVQNVTATFATASVGLYDGIYQWDTGYYLSVHQNAGTLIGSIYWVYSGNIEQVGSRSIPEADTFDLFSGPIVGSSATVSGTRFYRACKLGYDFSFNSDSSLTVRLNSVSNSPGVNPAEVNCTARFNPVGSTWTIPRIF
jgi:hypothetical protein